MVLPQDMRLFAADCLRWAEETDSVSHHDLMIQMAKSWITTAAGIERQVGDGSEVTPDLKPRPD